MSTRDRIPDDWPVQPLRPSDLADLDYDRAALCGTCGLSWDDSVVTSMTPAPSSRCPFEPFHEYDDDDEETGVIVGDEDPRTFAILALHADVVREDIQWKSLGGRYGVDHQELVHHVRHLENCLESLAAQVSELAQRLAAQ